MPSAIQSAAPSSVKIRMRLDGLQQLTLEEFALPTGLTMCTWDEGTDMTRKWVGVIETIFGKAKGWTEDRFTAEFVQQPQFDGGGVFFILNGDIVVGTAMCWIDHPE